MRYQHVDRTFGTGSQMLDRCVRQVGHRVIVGRPLTAFDTADACDDLSGAEYRAPPGGQVADAAVRVNAGQFSNGSGLAWDDGLRRRNALQASETLMVPVNHDHRTSQSEPAVVALAEDEVQPGCLGTG